MEEDLEKRCDARALALAGDIAKPTIIQALETDIDYFLKAALEERTETDRFGRSRMVKENIVDSKNIGVKITQCMKWITDENTDPRSKIKLCDFICNKLADYYRLAQEKREKICKELTTVVYEGEDMPNPLRLWYLKFRNEQVPYDTSIALFDKHVEEVMATVPYFQILKYILRSAYRKHAHEQSVLDKFEILFADLGVDLHTKMEIADIFLLNDREVRGQAMVNTLREMEIQLVLNLEDVANVQRYNRFQNIYGDSQNVHHTDINTSVLNACIELFKIEPVGALNITDVREILQEVATAEQLQYVDTVIERIQIDESRFKQVDDDGKQTVFSLYDAFTALWQFINKHPSKLELYARLLEEIKAMAKYCTTGHVSRFINVIQGYTDNEKLCVRISDATRIKSIVVYRIEGALREAPDEIQDSMIGDDMKLFYQFVEDYMNSQIAKIVEEHGDVQEHILTAVKDYTKWKWWKLVDNVLILEEAELEVDGVCMESYPCKHYCTLGKKKIMMDGVQIRNWYVKNGKEVPEHFREYTDYTKVERDEEPEVRNNELSEVDSSDEEVEETRGLLKRMCIIV